jgi:chromosome segregation ATPase
VIQQSSLDAQSTDVFYRTQGHLRTVSSLLSELTESAADFGQLVEFEKAQAPWVMKSKEVAGKKLISAAAEDEIRNLKRDLQERATMLKVRQQEIEEVKMKVDLLERRNKDAAEKLERMAELEKIVDQATKREQDLEREVEEQTNLGRKLEDERDSWMRKAAEGTAVVPKVDGKEEASAPGVGDVLVGSKAEMERLKGEIALLQEANRYLRKQVAANREGDIRDNWLGTPLKRRSVRKDDAVEDAKTVLRNIARLPIGVKPLRLDIGREREARKPTPKYQLVVEEMRKLKAWEPVKIAGVDLPIFVD